MGDEEKPNNSSDNLRSLLSSKIKEDLVVLAKRLEIKKVRAFSKNKLIQEIEKLPEQKVRKALQIPKQGNFLTHFYGLVGIILALAALAVAWWLYHLGPSKDEQSRIHSELSAFHPGTNTIQFSSTNIEVGLNPQNFSVRNTGAEDLYEITVELQLHSSVLSVTNNDIGIESIESPENDSVPLPILDDPFHQVMIADNGMFMQGRDSAGYEGLWIYIPHLAPGKRAAYRIKNQSSKQLLKGGNYLLASVKTCTNTLPESLGSMQILPQPSQIGMVMASGKWTSLATIQVESVEGAEFVTNALPLLKAGSWSEVESNATQAIEANPTFVPAYDLRCMVRIQKGEFENAYQDAQKELALMPDSWIARQHVAQCLLKLGRWNESLTSYNNAISLTNLPSLFYERGMVLAKLSRYNEAQEDFDKALSFGLTNEWVHFYKGVSFFNQNLLTNAITELKAALAMSPDMTEARTALNAAQSQLESTNRPK